MPRSISQAIFAHNTPRRSMVLGRAMWLSAFLGWVGLSITGHAQESFFRAFEQEARSSFNNRLTQNQFTPLSEVTPDADSQLNWFGNYGLSVSYDDNVNASEFSPQDDFILSPSAVLGVEWLGGPMERLNLSLSGNYSIFLEGSRTDDLFLDDGNALNYQRTWNNTTLSVYDRFSYSTDPAGEPGVADNAQFGGIRNTVGLNVSQRMGPSVLSLGFDHFDFFSTETLSNRQERSQNTLSASYFVNVLPYLSLGPRVSYAVTDNKDPLFNDSDTISASASANVLVTQDINMSANVGLVRFGFDDSGALNASDSSSLFYAFNLQHRFNEDARQVFSVSQSSQTGFNANLVRRFNVNYRFEWFTYEDFSFSLGLGYLNQEDETGFLGNAQQVNLIRVNPSARLKISDRSALSLSYNYQNRDSNIVNQSFSRNRFTLGYSLDF